ncbi:MAG: hypothetical protein JJ975_17510 [Bacteroidia bacterium]|nr:hypothetical protein [Bacteroidia bacterium]
MIYEKDVRRYLALALLTIFCFMGQGHVHSNENGVTMFSEKDVLEEFDLAFTGIASDFYPLRNDNSILYNFFPDLEFGYCEIAGSKMHLYSDSLQWAVVFEISGYQNRRTSAEAQLIYIGNCINYVIESYEGRTYISNSKDVVFITSSEFERIENQNGEELEIFELIAGDTKTIQVFDKNVPFESDHTIYEDIGIKIRSQSNPDNLIGFGDFVRFLHETTPEKICVREEDIRTNIPSNLQKIMTIENFHYESFYDKVNLPSMQETYQLVAKVLVSCDSAEWKPTTPPNNSWKNWESGNM